MAKNVKNTPEVEKKNEAPGVEIPVVSETKLKNFKCPDGSIFDREDLATDWCKMRKMDIGDIKKV